MRLERRCTTILDNEYSEFRIQDGRIPIEESGYDNPVLNGSVPLSYVIKLPCDFFLSNQSVQFYSGKPM